MPQKRDTALNGSIGTRLRQRRLELGLSQRDLSEPGVSYAYVSRIESGQRNPSLKALRKLAPKLKTSVVWLETGSEDQATELAQLVLRHQGKPLPPEATSLADSILSLPSGAASVRAATNGSAGSSPTRPTSTENRRLRRSLPLPSSRG